MTAEQRERYALFQFGTAVVWPSFLATAADLTLASALKQALKNNASCEIGASGDISHVCLARNFALSQGITKKSLLGWVENPVNQMSIRRMFMILDKPDAFKAGWMLGNEAFAAVMFEIFLPAFQQVQGCDVTYMTTHIKVDKDEHVRDILAGLREIFKSAESLEFEVMLSGFGLEQAFQARIEYLDYIQSGNMSYFQEVGVEEMMRANKKPGGKDHSFSL